MPPVGEGSSRSRGSSVLPPTPWEGKAELWGYGSTMGALVTQVPEKPTNRDPDTAAPRAVGPAAAGGVEEVGSVCLT